MDNLSRSELKIILEVLAPSFNRTRTGFPALGLVAHQPTGEITIKPVGPSAMSLHDMID